MFECYNVCGIDETFLSTIGHPLGSILYRPRNDRGRIESRSRAHTLTQHTAHSIHSQMRRNLSYPRRRDDGNKFARNKISDLACANRIECAQYLSLTLVYMDIIVPCCVCVQANARASNFFLPLIPHFVDVATRSTLNNNNSIIIVSHQILRL